MPSKTASSPEITRRSRKSSQEHKESIYNWIPREQAVSIAQSPDHIQYRSIYSSQTVHEYQGNRIGKKATMGPYRVKKENPKHFLHAHSGEMRLSEQATVKRVPKPAVNTPKLLDLPLWESKYPKEKPFPLPNYPKRTTRRAGELESYRAKEDYGKVPEYLAKQKETVKQVDEAKTLLKKAHVKVKNSTKLQPLPESERLDIVAGLEEQWKQLTLEFQKLPLVTDTVPKINRKVNLETKLKQIEADIDRFSHKNIIVYVD